MVMDNKGESKGEVVGWGGGSGGVQYKLHQEVFIIQNESDKMVKRKL